MATNTTKGNDNEQRATDQKNQQDSNDQARLRDDIDLDDVDASEEVTPRNIQVPPNDEDKDRQNEVLKKDHIDAINLNQKMITEGQI